MTKSLLFFHNYRYFPYEKDLARREVEALLQPKELHPNGQGFKIIGNFNENKLKRLVYFQKYTLENGFFDTLQHRLETSCLKTGRQKRQSTRYSVHGMHEYKGKFNPQIVRGILNILNVQKNATVVDPFCGSGTTLVECTHDDIKALGCDINPLAVFITNAKLQTLTVEAQYLRDILTQVVNGFSPTNKNCSPPPKQTLREEYLRKWFNQDILEEIECLKIIIETQAGNYKNIFLALASDLLREYSLQSPLDLRVRRRKSPLPSKPLQDAFQQKASDFINNLEAAQDIIGVKQQQNYACLCDSKDISRIAEQCNFTSSGDAIITSPPYATALPYIDTQRLSLVWLNLISPEELKKLDTSLAGSREFTEKTKQLWISALKTNAHSLPSKVHNYCLGLENALSSADGFRRQAVPYLMYRYFSDMQTVFRNTLNIVKEKAPFALVVGHNHTKLGNQKFDINTPALLKEVAVNCGWEHQESIPLQTYHRYSIHSANAVKTETLLILGKP